MIKKIILSFIIGVGVFMCFRLVQNKISPIQTKVVFINQVRGGECCQKGSIEFTKQQLELFKKYSLRSTFVLRYDVLKDEKYIQLLKAYRGEKVDYGLFFEVTPRLASDAGVSYKGTEDRWYRAQFAYLVGYSQEDRKKLIDSAVLQFKKQFGVYPRTTGGWMIDTYSATYLSTQYGVSAHEITREQWGTDGYALYGGSVVSAYAPLRNWIFLPAPTSSSALPLTIVRQTISDPVRNYGDLTSGYTSQPNDYGRTKWFSYFTHLLTQTQYYSTPLAVLGLENSLDKKYQDIYKKQIEFVYKTVDNENIIFPQQINVAKKRNYVVGSDYNNKSYKAFWIQTPQYRARIVQQNVHLSLTDLRVFDSTLIDPYLTTSTGEKTAFWEAPFVFDSSKRGLPKDTTELTRKVGAFLSSIGYPDWLKEQLNPVLNEKFLYEINGVTFPSIQSGTEVLISEEDDAIVMQYTKHDGSFVSLVFKDDTFTVKGARDTELITLGSIGGNTDLRKELKNGSTIFTPFYKIEPITPAASTVINTTAPQINPQVSVIYNAPLSLIDRNPARLVVVSKDSGGKPARLKTMTLTHIGGDFDSVKISETEGHLGEFDGMYYVDIVQKKAGVYSPILTYNEKSIELKPLSFILDCKKNIKICVMKPQLLIDYMMVKVGDVLNRR